MLRTYFVVLSALGFTCQAQTLNIAETGGKGRATLFVATNALVAKGYTTIPYTFGSFSYGLTNRVDLYVGGNAATVFGQTQVGVYGGANVTAWKSKWVNVSNYTLLSTPLSRRKDASGASLFTAAIVSKTLREKSKVIPYCGYSAVIPLGDAADKLFTAPGTVHNFPVGVMLPKGKLSYFAEYSFSRQVQAVSIGLAFSP